MTLSVDRSAVVRNRSRSKLTKQTLRLLAWLWECCRCCCVAGGGRRRCSGSLLPMAAPVFRRRQIPSRVQAISKDAWGRKIVQQRARWRHWRKARWTPSRTEPADYIVPIVPVAGASRNSLSHDEQVAKGRAPGAAVHPGAPVVKVLPARRTVPLGSGVGVQERLMSVILIVLVLFRRRGWMRMLESMMTNVADAM